MKVSEFIVPSIYLDKRRLKENKKHPVKLKIYFKKKRVRKFISTAVDLSVEEFEKVWTKANFSELRGRNKELNTTFSELIDEANRIIKSFEVFNFEEFKEKLMAGITEGDSIQTVYAEKIESLKDKNAYSSIDTYVYSLKALEAFSKKNNKKPLSFEMISVQWLRMFEDDMIKIGRSVSTVGIYLRPLKAIFNMAKEKGLINEYSYPFGVNKYSIPSSTKVKKALSSDDLRVLLTAVPESNLQQQAIDFWTLSFMCNGINLTDIAHLKYQNLDLYNKTLHFVRIKTANNRPVKKIITVKLNQLTIDIIEKYKVTNNGDYIFDLISPKDSIEKARKKIKNYNHSINKQLKKLAKNNDLDPSISFYWARHTFSTIAITKGKKGIEFVQEALGHSSIKTTQNYFGGFANNEKEEFADYLMDLVK